MPHSLHSPRDGSRRLPIGFQWRSSKAFIIVAISMGLFIDAVLYGLIIPCLPFMLESRVSIKADQVQYYISALLTTYAVGCAVASPLSGMLADAASSRQTPFILGLLVLTPATALLFLGRSLITLFAARVLQGISAAMAATAGFALCLETVGTDDMGKTTGPVSHHRPNVISARSNLWTVYQLYSMVTLGTLGSPFLGGIIYTKAGWQGVFILSCCLLLIDLGLRLLIIDGSNAHRYTALNGTRQEEQSPSVAASPNDECTDLRELELDESHTERTRAIAEGYYLSRPLPRLLRSFPILACLTNPRFLVALLANSMHAVLVSSFEATLPVIAQEYFAFNALQSGLLFLPLSIAEIIVAAATGWIVDKAGPRVVASFSYAYLAIALILLRPSRDASKHRTVLFCSLLAANGAGIGAGGTPGTVEAGLVIEKYRDANPDLYGEAGPYAQMFALLDMSWSGGMALGPQFAGALTDVVGYSNMNAALAFVCAVTALLCAVYMERKSTSKSI